MATMPGDRFNSDLATLIIENEIPITDLKAIVFPDGKDANDLLLSNELANYQVTCNIVDFETIKNLIEEAQKQKEENELPTLPTTDIEQIKEEERVFNTPVIPRTIYNNLPKILKDSVVLFKDDIEKDVFLVGAIGVLSACLPNVKGKYFNMSYSPHLYIFITAPAGSGKGVLKWAKFFGQVIHDKIIEESKDNEICYEAELENYLGLKRSERAMEPKPVKPPFRMFYIPANSSAAGFVDVLTANQNMGILFETEADTLSQTFKNDWGSYSDILRKAFHHETTNQKRKDSYIEIKEPHLAVVLSGTPRQVTNLMPDEENGLFSRFMYYAFEDNGEFKNPFTANNSLDFKDYFVNKGQEIFNLYEQLNNLTDPIDFQVTPEQGKLFTETFNKMIKRNRVLVGKNFDANTKRLGLITFRIAMTLSVLNIIDDGNITNPMVCSEELFKASMELAFILEKHAIEVFKKLPSHNLKGNQQIFYDALPDNFDRQAYLAIAQEKNIGEKAAEKYIKQYKDKGLLDHKYNNYSKIKT
jgi:hypothetical protein